MFNSPDDQTTSEVDFVKEGVQFVEQLISINKFEEANENIHDLNDHIDQLKLD